MIPIVKVKCVLCPSCKFPAVGCEANNHYLRAKWLKVICQCQPLEPNPKLEEMVKRSIEIGRDIAKQAQKMDKWKEDKTLSS